MRKIFKYLTHRMVIVSLLILIQLGWFAIFFIRFTSYNQMISAGIPDPQCAGGDLSHQKR